MNDTEKLFDEMITGVGESATEWFSHIAAATAAFVDTLKERDNGGDIPTPAGAMFNVMEEIFTAMMLSLPAIVEGINRKATYKLPVELDVKRQKDLMAVYSTAIEAFRKGLLNALAFELEDRRKAEQLLDSIFPVVEAIEVMPVKGTA